MMLSILPQPSRQHRQQQHQQPPFQRMYVRHKEYGDGPGKPEAPQPQSKTTMKPPSSHPNHSQPAWRVCGPTQHPHTLYIKYRQVLHQCKALHPDICMCQRFILRGWRAHHSRSAASMRQQHTIPIPSHPIPSINLHSPPPPPPTNQPTHHHHSSPCCTRHGRRDIMQRGIHISVQDIRTYIPHHDTRPCTSPPTGPYK